MLALNTTPPVAVTSASTTVTWPNTANMNSAPNSTTALPWP